MDGTSPVRHASLSKETGAALRPDQKRAHSAPASEPARTKKGRRDIPGPRSVPLAGWWPVVLPMLRDPAMNMLRLWRAYGDVVALGQRKSAPVMVFSPEYNRQLLTHNDVFHSLDVNSGNALIKIPQGTSAARLLSGIASMNGDEHTRHRRLLMPAFHKKHIDNLRDAMVGCVETHISRWKPGERLVLANEMLDLTLSVATMGLIGLDPQQEGLRVRGLIDNWSRHGLTPQVALLPYDFPGSPYRRFKTLTEKVEVELLEIIRRKRAKLDEGRRTTDESSYTAEANGIPHDAFHAPQSDGDALTLLLEARHEDGTGMSQDDLLGHLSTLFTAGHETTASALTWTLFLLSQHPQVLGDLIDELDSTLHGEAPTIDQLKSLPLLENVVNEGLRMFPPGMWIFRTAVAPFELGQYALPSGTQLIFSPTVTHYRPDIYTHPHRFDPHRWETLQPDTYEYIPFGGGARRCLGAIFALLEMKLALALILQRWRLEVPYRHKVDRGGTILSFPTDGLPITLRTQDRQFSHSAVKGNIHGLVEFPWGTKEERRKTNA